MSLAVTKDKKVAQRMPGGILQVLESRGLEGIGCAVDDHHMGVKRHFVRCEGEILEVWVREEHPVNSLSSLVSHVLSQFSKNRCRIVSLLALYISSVEYQVHIWKRC